MTKYLKKCKNCNRYALKNPENECPYCEGELINPKPPKFSLVDKYAKYRLQYFKEKYKKPENS